MSSSVILRLRQLYKRLANSHFVSSVITVGGGIAASQAIALAFSPFLTRIYGPEAFGLAAAFAALVSILTPLATCGYANAIVMPVRDEDAGALARLSIFCALIMGPTAMVAIHLGSPWLIKWTKLEEAPWILYLIPMSMVISALLSVANQSAIRQSLYRAKAKAYVGSTLLINLAKVASGMVAPSGLLLVLLTLTGGALNFLMQLVSVSRQDSLKFRNWFGLRGVREAAWVQRDFAMYRMPQSVLNAATVGMPILLLTSLFGSSAAGQYALAAAALAAPLMLLGEAVGEVFYPKITQAIAQRSPKAYSLLVKATLGLMCVALIPFGVTMLWGDRLFPMIFGNEWRKAGQYAQWMALWLAITLIGRASVAAMPALKLQGVLLGREIASIVLRAGALYLGFAWYHSDIVAVALFSLTGMLVNLFQIYMVCRRLSQCSSSWSAGIIKNTA